jgi:bloom syndrome protein
MENLDMMFGYCENKTDCRRVQQLEYFGEVFRDDFCKFHPEASCDNCSSEIRHKMIDVTEDCKEIVKTLKYVSHGQTAEGNVTVMQAAHIFNGIDTAKIKDNRHYYKLGLYGRGRSYKKIDAERLLRKLVVDEILEEELILNGDAIAQSFVRPGPKAEELLNDRLKVLFRTADLSRPMVTVQVANQASMNATLDDQIGQLQQRCYRELIDECRSIAARLGRNFGAVMTVETLREMSIELPESPEQMLQVPGVTRANLEMGKRFLNITAKYAEDKLVLLTEATERQMENGTLPIPSTSRGIPPPTIPVIEEWESEDDDETWGGDVRDLNLLEYMRDQCLFCDH